MKMSTRQDNGIRVIISGGGTGGHIFPALSIADALSRRFPQAQILFVGAEGRMEMQKIPEAGYRIEGLPVAGLDRKRIWRNIKVVYKLWKSLRRAKQIIKDFRPNMAIGVGGYASAPTLHIAHQCGIPTLIQEQNSYAGLANRFLARQATTVCVAYQGMDRFFPKQKIVLTGNPIRQSLTISVSKEKAYHHFRLNPQKKTILLIGGSLGAKTFNTSFLNHLDKLLEADVQVLWQSGSMYYSQVKSYLSDKKNKQNIHLYDFISEMAYAYAVADIVVSRAGAGSISELAILGKASILVPSPNVAEDHQTKNALALVEQNAAMMVSDSQAPSELVNRAIGLLHNDAKINQLEQNIKKMALPNAAEKIVDEIENIIKKQKQ